MDFATTKREVLRWVCRERRRYGMYMLQHRPGRMRWERWQKHVSKSYRKAAEDWRMWGVRVARGEADPPGGKLVGRTRSQLPLERLCHAAYRAGYEDEKRRLALVAKRKHDWTPIGTLQEHLLGTAKLRIDCLK